MLTYSGFYHFYVIERRVFITLMPEISSISDLTPAEYYYRRGDVFVSEDGNYVELSGNVYWVYYSAGRTALKDVPAETTSPHCVPTEQRTGMFSSKKEMFYPKGTRFVQDYTSTSNKVVRFYNFSVEVRGEASPRMEAKIE